MNKKTYTAIKAWMENGSSLRDIKTDNTNHRSLLLRGTFTNSLLSSDDFGDIIVNDNINLSFANAKSIIPPSGYKLVKIEKDEEAEKAFIEDCDNFFKSL